MGEAAGGKETHALASVEHGLVVDGVGVVGVYDQGDQAARRAPLQLIHGRLPADEVGWLIHLYKPRHAGLGRGEVRPVLQVPHTKPFL